MRSKSTWMMGVLGVMPVWLENEEPRARIRSHSFMNQLATGVPDRPSTPAASG